MYYKAQKTAPVIKVTEVYLSLPQQGEFLWVCSTLTLPAIIMFIYLILVIILPISTRNTLQNYSDVYKLLSRWFSMEQAGAWWYFSAGLTSWTIKIYYLYSNILSSSHFFSTVSSKLLPDLSILNCNMACFSKVGIVSVFLFSVALTGLVSDFIQ